MKKLLMSVAVVLVSVVANAASCSWGTDSISAYTTDNGYAIYAFDISKYAIDTAVEDFKNGAFDFTKGEAGEIDGSEAAGDLSGYANGGEVNMFLVVFNDEDAANATAAFFSTVENTTIPSTGVGASVEFDLSDSAIASNWTSVGGEVIPEPSSALLLLLGMAGLALKRKQA